MTMRQIEKNGYVFECYSKQELNSNTKLYEEMTSIILSYQRSMVVDYNEALNDLDDNMQDFLSYENNDAWLYLLRNKESDEPISFALYSKEDDKEAVHLEMIYTDLDRCGNGFAEILLANSCKDLSAQGYNMISSVVNAENDASNAMHSSFAKHQNVKLYCSEIYGNRYEYEIDISNINSPKMENENEFEF